ncbi:hypothetical protein [Actinomadura livida]|uniref:Uncharacterized protein n=1 Tax=Actinomadura livida TaxID=79909 RepID=A0A7W7I7A5_9ACTN|nr:MULTISPECIES: hypothetical protein [Actinomadura]MBB4771851.1 hypothetical protein [Actinomadura catellatispora]GGU02861.1 hypothetical protein GCM10010208_28740 [Actinomadura livida]
MILHAHGRVSWERARDLLSGTECAWTDLDGAHIAAPPADIPLGAGHLWAWDPDRCLRLRFDDDAVYVGELTETGAGETVTVTVRTGIRLWGPGDLQAGPLPDEARVGHWDLLEVTGSRPATFVRRRT